MLQLQLAIPEPCHQDWDKMTPNEQGNFCNSCAKTVIDFSAMTDAQLLNYFQQLKGKDVCGKAHPDQLQRTINSLPAPRKKIFRYWQYMAAFFILFIKGQQAKAQMGLFAVSKTAQTPDKAVPKKVSLVSLIKRIIVTDTDDQPIAGASIKFLSGRNILLADSMGIVYIDKEDQNETLIISAVGYKEQRWMIKDIQFGKIRMEQDIQSLEAVTVQSYGSSIECYVLGGMISGMYIVAAKEDSISKFINYIAPSVTAYPNPVVSGSAVNLSLKIKKAGNYRFYIYDASGKLMLAQNHTVPEKAFIQQINIPTAWSHAIYFVAVVAEDGKNVGKVKIVVQ